MSGQAEWLYETAADCPSEKVAGLRLNVQDQYKMHSSPFKGSSLGQ
jgi:hypothetical protein